MSMKDYEQFLEQLRIKRGPAESQAAQLIRKGKFDEAEQIVRQADDSIYGAVAIAKLFDARLREMIAAGELKRNKAAVEVMYKRTLKWKWSCYPEPHTECEAEDYDKGRDEDKAELVKLMGYDPGSPY